MLASASNEWVALAQVVRSAVRTREALLRRCAPSRALLVPLFETTRVGVLRCNGLARGRTGGCDLVAVDILAESDGSGGRNDVGFVEVGWVATFDNEPGTVR